MFARSLFDKLPEGVQNTARSFVRGVQKADEAQRVPTGAGSKNPDNTVAWYGQSILDPRYRKRLENLGVSAKKDPAEFLGAYSSRFVVDIANDGTRTYFWRYNHPLAVSTGLSNLYLEKYLAPKDREFLNSSPTGRALLQAGIGFPAIAAAGTYDITNPEEQFRPKGYAQRYSEVGSEDRRTTTQPGAELFERFFLGRTGDPLKYETAKQDIPNLTPERYANYQRFLYQDKGLLGLGILKATPENLEGEPEVRLLGFPANIPMAGGFAGGTVAAGAALSSRRSPLKAAQRPATRLAGAFGAAVAGSVGGVMLGNVANEVIARANRPTYPSTTSYDQNVS